MKVTDPCSICGCKDLDLVDGFYYCVECGTQDTKVRETLIQHNVLTDGTFGQTTKKKILKINEDKVEMSAEWHKWHAFNFMLLGLANELVALGVAPSFKKKLLWIWMRYMKKHQKNEEIGLNNCTETDKSRQNAPENLSNTDNGTQKKKGASERAPKFIKSFSQGLLITMLYVALSFDKSEIQISHIKRMIDEGRLHLLDLPRYIPEGINVKAVGSDWIIFLKSCNPINFYGMLRYRAVAMSLITELELGTPFVPDIRKIIDNFIKELCLPIALKNLVFSLMHLWPCELDVDYGGLTCALRVPEYEAVAMAYILVALKMCFGLDGDYEYKLSKAVDKINEKNLFPKSYKLGFTPESTDRLFSFQDWFNYLQLRRKMMSKYLQINIDKIHYNDTDHFVFLEHLPERPKGKVFLTDELAMQIVNQIPEDADTAVIPKNEIPWTLTPMVDYTEVIMNYCKDSKVIQILNEDFSNYSLKYACENLELLDIKGTKNVVKGISDYNKTIRSGNLSIYKDIAHHTKWIYIKNCDNKHWLKTKKPSMQHVTVESSERGDPGDPEIRDDKESDHGYDSNIENTTSDKDESGYVSNEVVDSKLETIKEEEEGKNIFDDEFDDVDYKEEDEVEDDNNFDIIQEQIENNNEQQEQSDTDEAKSVSSEQSFEFNPDTFNRERAIKELILKACRKYNIPIQKEYKTVEPRKRKHDSFHDETERPKKKYAKSKPGETKMEISKLLDVYYSNMERDVVSQVAQQVKNVIRNMDLTKEQIDIEDPPKDQQSETTSLINIGTPTATDIGVVEGNRNEHNATQVECEQENFESTLFEEDSDIEANIDELIPKGDPRYDEKKYNVDQLYIKMQEFETEDIFNAANFPEIDKILDEKIKQGYNDPPNLIVDKPIPIKEDSSDSDDELPLSTIKEVKEIYSKDYAIENLVPLIKKTNIPKFKYWLRHYKRAHMHRVYNYTDKFDSELARNTPQSFNFIIQECAFISGYTAFRLYRSMQVLENNLVKYSV